MADEAELVRRIVELDDAGAKGDLVRMHQARVTRLVASVLGPARREEVDDVVQQAFLRALRRLESFRLESSLGTWLHRVAYSTAIDHLRRVARRREDPVDALETLPDGTTSPLGAALQSEQRSAVRAALDRIPPAYRTALVLFYWYEAPIAEIATALGVPENSAKSLLHRGRKRLARILEAIGGQR